jgi:hypothetical protein
VITGAEISRALRAVWLLFLDRSGAMSLFDTTTEGFWRSFQAILLVAPVYAFVTLADQQFYLADPDIGPTFDSATFFFARAVTLSIDWVTFPILLALLGGWLGIRSGYAAFIVARNWGNVFTIVPYAAVSLLELAGVAEGGLILVPAVVALAAALRLGYITARRALGVSIDMAIGFVVLDFLVSLGLSAGIAYLFGVAS